MARVGDRVGRVLCLLTAVLPVLAATGAETALPAGTAHSDVAAGVAAWRPYEATAPQTVIAASAEQPHSGPQALRLDTPGKRRLEGASTTLTVQPDRSYRVDAWVRGSGTLMLAVLKKQGWVYGRAFTPGADWACHSVRFLSDAPTASLSLLTTASTPQAVTVCIDDLAVSEEAAPEAPAVAVPPCHVEAEEYRAPATCGEVVSDPGARGGAYVAARRYYWLAYDVPLVPQTALPFFIYLRTRADTAAPCRVSILRPLPDQPAEVLGSVPVAAAAWAWVRAGPYSYRLGKTFSVSAGGADAAGTVALDGMVISTDGGLTDNDLSAGVATP